MSKDVPIVCINLERATERRAMIEKEWVHDRSCPVHFIDAYDRRDVEEGRLLFDYDSTAAVKFFNRALTSGEIACATSHALAVKYAKEKELGEVIIIEDDMLPLFKDHNQLVQIISAMHDEFTDTSIAMLHAEHPSLPYQFKQKKYQFGLLSRASYGACTYYLHNQVYDSFLNDLLSYRAPADWHWKKYIDDNILVAPLKQLTQHSAINTYIGNEHRGPASHRLYIE